MHRLKPYTYFLLSIMVILILSACSSIVTEQSEPEPKQNSAVIASFDVLDRLDNISTLFDVNRIIRLKEFSCEGQPVSSEHTWNGNEQGVSDICQPAITNGQTLMFDFMFKEDVNIEDGSFELLFGDYETGDENIPALELRLPVGMNTLSTYINGEPYEQYDFNPEITWQAEQVYTALVSMAQNGCMDVMVWFEGGPSFVARAGTCQQEWRMDFPNQDSQTALQFALSLPSGQAVKVSNMWLLDMSDPDSPSAATTSNETIIDPGTEPENEARRSGTRRPFAL